MMQFIKKFLRDIYLHRYYYIQKISLSLRWYIFRLTLWPLVKIFPIKNLNKNEFQLYSQNGEDGILYAIFSKIGTTNKYFVEFGVQDGSECNARLLREQMGWHGLMMDGGSHNSPHVKKEFITAENINDLFIKYKVPEEFDLLSVDIDGNDYWVWEKLDHKYSPRVLVIEYNASIPPDRSLSIKYEPDFRWDGTNYFGASIGALVKISEKKGYRLVVCDRNGVNAFFVRNDLIQDNFILHSPNELFYPPGYGNPPGSGHPPSTRTMIEV